MRSFVTRCLAALALLASVASPAGAQMSSGSSGGGQTISPRVEASYSHSRVDSAGHVASWMQYMILWRGQAGWTSGRMLDPVASAEGQRAYKQAQLAAAAADRSFFGGGGATPYWGEIDRQSRRLYLLGQEYAIPGRDSALVVLIDRIDNVGGPAVVIGAAVVDGRLPPEVDTKTWVSGDTTFMVRPSRSAVEVFLGMLKEDAVIAAFLSDTP